MVVCSGHFLVTIFSIHIAVASLITPALEESLPILNLYLSQIYEGKLEKGGILKKRDRGGGEGSNTKLLLTRNCHFLQGMILESEGQKKDIRFTCDKNQ